MLKNSTVTWEWIFSHMKNIDSSCALPWHRRECTTWSFWTLSKTLSTKWTLQTLLILFTAAKVFCSKDLQFWISFSSISVPKIILLSVQFEKNTLFPIFATFAFSKVIHEYKAKVSDRTGAVGPLISPCGLNPASGTAWGIPSSVAFPLPSTSPLPFPFATFRLWI